MTEKREKYKVVPFPKARQPIIDALRQAKNRSVIHALVEVDITDARKWVREYRRKAGEPLSFTAFLVFCLARSIDENQVVHAYRKGGKLIIFDEVDVAVQIERDIMEEGKIPIYPHVIKASNRKTLKEIHYEITTAKEEDSARIARWTNRYWYLPGFVRSLLWRMWLGSPYWRKRLTGTVGLSAVGMFGRGAGWGIPISTYTLSITTGGVSEKPGVFKGQIEVREYLSITASFDHDIVDGAPAARFIQKFKELIESGFGLHD